MFKITLLAVPVVAVAALSLLARGQQAPSASAHNPSELSGLMRAKLASSQKVVEGLMAKDFELIGKGADEMRTVCDATEWPAIKDEVYAHYHAEMRRTAAKISRLAEEENLDGAAYTYMHSLTTCISCHDYCREVLRVADELPDLQPVPGTPMERDAATGRAPKLQR